MTSKQKQDAAFKRLEVKQSAKDAAAINITKASKTLEMRREKARLAVQRLVSEQPAASVAIALPAKAKRAQEKSKNLEMLGKGKQPRRLIFVMRQEDHSSCVEPVS